MMSSLREIDWDDLLIAVPAFLTMVAMPLTFSVANGLTFGFISYTLIRVFSGQYRSVSWVGYALTALFILRFLFIKG
jgi:AGZA family xanthine/uracil permease-like MFS transporter